MNQYETTIHYFEIAIVTWNRRMTALNRESSFPQIEDNFYILFLSFKKNSSCPILHSQLFEKLGYGSVVLQIGRGVFEPDIIDKKNLSMQYYRYKDSIAEDIQSASLVISHAGKFNFN